MLPTQVTQMCLLMLLLLMWDFTAMTAAQPRCDPRTQYEKNGECCKMCGPGTRSSSSSSCLDPTCIACGDNEYQDKYTNKLLCERHPYCDPHKNFQTAVHKSKKHRSPCLCKEGFHCSGRECITCVGHTTCELGLGARYKGNHTHDTVCQKCTDGTFSDDNSWDGICKKWTECGYGYDLKQSGTDISDNICEKPPRTHVIVIAVCSVIVFLVGGFILFFRCKKRVKVCVESCLGNKREPLRETNVLIQTPTDPIEESTMPELQSSREEEGGVRTPEENEDGMSQEVSGDVVLTENGNFVTQENGKSSILSRQESQPQTFID